MTQPSRSPTRSVPGSLVLIAVVMGRGGAAFDCTAAWFSPQRFTPGQYPALGRLNSGTGNPDAPDPTVPGSGHGTAPLDTG
jgi:hypothetical protein